MTIYLSPDGQETIYPYSLVIKYIPGSVIVSQRSETGRIPDLINGLHLNVVSDNVESITVIKHKLANRK